MQNAKNVLTIVQIALAILVILGILLQTPSASGLGGTIGGGSDSGGGGYRRRRGVERTMLRSTAVLIAVFVVVSGAIAFISARIVS